METTPAARLLDALTDWIIGQIAHLPVRGIYQDGIFLRATEMSQIRALKVYRTSGSFDEALNVGKDIFKVEVRARAVPDTQRSDGPDLRVEHRETTRSNVSSSV